MTTQYEKHIKNISSLSILVYRPSNALPRQCPFAIYFKLTPLSCFHDYVSVMII